MDYIPRPGIVCVPLCGRRVLVPTRQASEYCSSVFTLTGLRLMVWTAIEHDYPMEQLLDLYGIFTKLDQAEKIRKIEDCCQKLLELGFIMRKPEAADKDNI